MLPERGTGDGALERVSKFIPAKCAAKCAAHLTESNFQPRSSYFLFFFRCISQITPRPKQRIQTTTETAIKGQKLERYEPSPVSLIRRFRPSAAPLLSPAPAKAAVSSDMFRPDVLLSAVSDSVPSCRSHSSSLLTEPSSCRIFAERLFAPEKKKSLILPPERMNISQAAAVLVFSFSGSSSSVWGSVPLNS